MKNAAYKIIAGLVLVLLVALAAFVVVLQRHESRVDSCKGVSARTEGEWNFIDGDDVCKWVWDEFGQVQGLLVDSVSLYRIESYLNSRRIVEKSQVWFTPDDSLHILVQQRRPMVRFLKDGRGLYADRSGICFPLQKKCTAKVPVIDGFIPSEEGDSLFTKQLLELSAYMDRSGIWARDIERICVDEKGELLLIPRKGKEVFIFGKPGRVEEKFRKMEEYYSQIAPSREAGHYSSVNLKYKGQIICRQ